MRHKLLRRTLSIIMVLLQTCVYSQKEFKHDYSSSYLHDDKFLEEIIYCNRAIRCLSIFGKVKSVHCITTNSKTGQKSSQKYFYDDKKRLERLILFDNHQIIKEDREIYYPRSYEGPSVIKKSTQRVLENSLNTRIESKLDSTNKIIVLSKYRNEKLAGLDSILYIEDYKPVLIKKYSSENDLISTKKYEYNKDKISLYWEVRQSGLYAGRKRFYDKNDRFIYTQKIISVDIKTLEYEVDETKDDCIYWHPDKFILHRKNSGDTLTYNYKSKKLTQKKGNLNVTCYLDDNHRVSQRVNESDDLKQPEIINYSYNEFIDIKSSTNQDVSSNHKNKIYDYIYDDQNNWTKIKVFVNEELYEVINREIVYYK